MDKKKWIRHLPLYILELVVLAAAIGALYFITHATKAQKQQIKEEDIAVNEEIKQQFQNEAKEDQAQDPQKPDLSGVYQIALFGVDARDGSLGKGNRSDTIMICSVDADTHEVKNPSEFMLNGKPEEASGSIVVCSMEGTRPILIEIQALVCHSNFGIPRRQAIGTDFNRVNLLMAVLEKRLGLQMGNCDAYVNIAGGIRISEPAIDLGIALAIISSFKNKVIDEKTIAMGEIGLSGEVRAVSMIPVRVQEAKKLGFTTCIIPAVCVDSVKNIRDITILGVKSVADAMQLI